MKTNKYILLTFFFLFYVLSYAQQYTEYEIKAAFLCNFAKFVEWTPQSFDSDTSPIIIGIVGDDPFGPVLERIAKNVLVNDRKIIIKRFANTDKIFDSHILFISSSMDKILTQILDTLKGTAILTVSEMNGFCEAGGIINFSEKEIKYGFKINAKSAQNAGLKISSKLLTLATIVE